MKKASSLILLLLPVFCFSATFTVTSNTFSGPGSLAEAIRSATQNGTGITDTILFNLPFGQTTITINAPLTIPSNIIIDGTAQPGKAFGLSNAKVQLQAAGCVVAFLIDSQEDVQVFGLWFSDFTSTTAGCKSAPLSIRNTNRLTIGKPGKGNCFSNSLYDIINPWQPGDLSENTNITVQSNRFGMDTTAVPDYISSTIAFGATRNLIFGGDNATEGNRVGNGFVKVGNADVPLTAGGDTIAFKNNAFAFDAFNSPLLSGIGLSVTGFKAATSALQVIIANNKIGKDDEINKVLLSDIKGDIKIYGNYIGSLNTAVMPGDVVPAIYLQNCQRKDSISIRNNVINGYETAIRIDDTRGVTILNNSIYCNQKGIRYKQADDVPPLSFTNLTPTYIKGITSPLSRVEIFSNTVCMQYCENGRTLVATVTAGSNGVFEYTGTLAGKVSATATSPSGSTSEFYGPKYSLGGVKIKSPACEQANGYISGLKIIQGTTFHWEDSAGNLVGTDTLLKNLASGRYRMYIKDIFSDCPAYTPYFTLRNVVRPVITSSSFTISNTTCALSIGKIKMTGTKSPASGSIWQDSLYSTLSTGIDSLVNLPAGLFHFKIALIDDSTCFTSYGPFRVLNKAGPALNTSNVQIADADCNAPTGSIKNITVQNAASGQVFRWEDSTGAVVGNNIDLLYQQGGKYRLKYKDSTACDTAITSYFTIGLRGGITIDSSHRIITPNACTTVNGAIKNLAVTGANLYEWINENSGNTVSTQLDLLYVPGGFYRLRAGNAIGCKDSSTTMFVPQNVFAPIAVTAIDSQSAHCNLANGYARPLTFSADTLLYKFEWRDNISNQIISSRTAIQATNPGNFSLLATDTNGCYGKILNIKITQTGAPVMDYAMLQAVPDTCDQGVGRLTNLVITGGKAPFAWQWFKYESAIPFAFTANQVAALNKGTYKAIVKDAADCAVTSKPFAIENQPKQLTLPEADDQNILRNTSAEIVIKNYQAGKYLLFGTSTANTPLSTTTTPRLSTPKVATDQTFYVQFIKGTCVSLLKPVLVKVFDKSMYTLPNAFSPNGDGMNDVWKMNVQGTINVKEWVVFNRYGQQIFSAKSASATWDGTYKNTPLPVGTYYYVLTATDNEGHDLKSNGSVTIVR